MSRLTNRERPYAWRLRECFGDSCAALPRYPKESTEVDLQDRFDQLLALADRLGLSIRREPLGGEGGGYCVIKGKPVLFVDTLADLETRYDRTLTTLARLPQIEEHFISPELRDELVRAKG